MVYISDDGTAKTPINHEIIAKGKCIYCYEQLSDPKDGLYECFKCRSARLRADARYRLNLLLTYNKDLPKETIRKIKEIINELKDEE